ncbi:phosphate transporter [Glomus cerebriforme]|uniref:Phosphate transporter n=1 Tax=Glomus cerebriforme TaxID=658196 RepID=A0A397TFX8_9GLOM|nr:phosphate transporter [Glomus cerebriforme]
MEPHSYVWLFVIGAIISFAGGFGIGANDVANSFSSSIGSRALTLKQACCIAIFTEFLGAFLLGSNTSETIGEGIIKVSLFQSHPEVLMLAMVCALVVSTTWVLFASSRGWPVSTTHSIVGAIIGVGVASFGWKAIDWSIDGLAKIIISWFVAPIVSGIAASIIFLATKYLVLEHQETSFQRGLIAIPIYFAIIIAINVFYIIFKGPSNLKLDNLKPYIIASIVVGVTIIAVTFSHFFYVQYLKRKILRKETGLRWYHVFIIPFIGERYENNVAENGIEKQEGIEVEENKDVSSGLNPKKNIFQSCFATIGNYVARSINKEVADYKAHDNKEIHDFAIKYDPDTESLYSFLQILTSSFVSFAHGSNDVSNAVGPFSIIYLIYQYGVIQSGGETIPIWIVALGGFAIDLGLVLYGYHVMRSLGNRITYQSPSRGFSMELGTSLAIITASKMGLPISTTHCITGATTAVGLCNGNAKALNWKLIGWCFFSWILTVPVVALLAGCIFAFVANAPSLRGTVN